MIKDFLEFFYNNHQIMWDNIVVFIIWGLLCSGITGAITSVHNTRLRRTNDVLKDELAALKEKYSQLDENERLLMGLENSLQPSAKAVSKRFKHKRKNK
ncbi:MAG: hypothetical protein NC313_09245 [Butyrivibrio sp.]|nr:hypothetical protein [Butyrivibrio sp.]